MFQQVLYILRCDSLVWIIHRCGLDRFLRDCHHLGAAWTTEPAPRNTKTSRPHTQPKLLYRARQTPASDHSPFPYDKRFLQWDQRIRMERDNPRRKVMCGAGEGQSAL